MKHRPIPLISFLDIFLPAPEDLLVNLKESKEVRLVTNCKYIRYRQAILILIRSLHLIWEFRRNLFIA